MNSICPGITNTALVDDFRRGVGADVLDRATRIAGRMAEPSEMAPALLFLADDASASYINGVNLNIDRGTGAAHATGALAAGAAPLASSSSERLRAEPLPGKRLAPAAVALRKLAAGKTNAMRNEHVEPVSPNANATFGTYSERYRAHVMEATATTVASRLAISGDTAARSSLVSPLCVRSA